MKTIIAFTILAATAFMIISFGNTVDQINNIEPMSTPSSRMMDQIK